jgi:hypothetical protein
VIGGEVVRRASGVAIVILAALTLVGCRRGTGLPDGLLQVANLSRSEASVTWVSPGFLGQERHFEPIPACDDFQLSFAERTEVTIRTTQGQNVFVVEGRASSVETVLQLVIAEDGSVAEVPVRGTPARPYCVD